MIEIRENGRFRKITQRRINGIKNHSIWISICEEIKERSGEKFPNAIKKKTENKRLIKLN